MPDSLQRACRTGTRTRSPRTKATSTGTSTSRRLLRQRWTVERISPPPRPRLAPRFSVPRRDFFSSRDPNERAWGSQPSQPGGADLRLLQRRGLRPRRLAQRVSEPRVRQHVGGGRARARIVSRFTPAQIQAAVRAGDFTDPAHKRVPRTRPHRAAEDPRAPLLLEALAHHGHYDERRSSLRRRPRAQEETWAPTSFRYRATIAARLRRQADSGSASRTTDASASRCRRRSRTAASRTTRLGLLRRRPHRGTASKSPLEVHLYDRGSQKGITVVGIGAASDKLRLNAHARVAEPVVEVVADELACVASGEAVGREGPGIRGCREDLAPIEAGGVRICQPDRPPFVCETASWGANACRRAGRDSVRASSGIPTSGSPVAIGVGTLSTDAWTRRT